MFKVKKLIKSLERAKGCVFFPLFAPLPCVLAPPPPPSSFLPAH